MISKIFYSVVFIISVSISFYIGTTHNPLNSNSKNVVSPYVGQEIRQIKSLSPEDIQALKEGSGVAFGGMAKPAELSSFPGPKHVLELSNQLNLTPEQKTDIESIFNEMQASAIRLGNELITIEQEINNQFTNKTITENTLQKLLNDGAILYGQLRNTHLKAHLFTVKILSQEQVALYNQLRGYNSDDPCLSVPEGHDPTTWKLHNGCE